MTTLDRKFWLCVSRSLLDTSINARKLAQATEGNKGSNDTLIVAAVCAALSGALLDALEQYSKFPVSVKSDE